MMLERRTILAVDDTVANLDIIVDLLKDFDVIEATGGPEALEIVAEEAIDLILLDIMMPEMDGYTVCRKLKQNEKTKDIPIIFITARTEEDAIEKAYDEGGVDYVTKPFKPKELLARVKIQLEHQEMIEKLEFLASYDAMTGIYNRRKFFELAKRKFAENPDNLYAAMLDIDKFKHINDSYGHAVGDMVIKAVTRVIAENIEPDSIFGRLGGEEFAIICRHSDEVCVVEKLELLRKKVEELKIELVGGELVGCTISEGVAAADASTRTLDELLHRADEMLYKAKGSGRNRTIFRLR
ncbi:MAG: diguanylate cyclase [Deltaproteobacteria bacterium]|nr:diguanylate cyclase [Deltaproteobacteria bacterium]